MPSPCGSRPCLPSSTTRKRSQKIYERLEPCLLRFRSLRSLRFNLGFDVDIGKLFDASELPNMRLSVFDGSLGLVQLTFPKKDLVIISE